jgi:hypothetical protein
MRFDLNKIYSFFIIIILIVLLFREGCNQKKVDDLIDDISNYKTEAQVYKTKLGLEINTNRALSLNSQKQMRTLLATNDTLMDWIKQFKVINGAVTLRETTIIKEIVVPFDRIIPCDFKPFSANKINKDFQFYTKVSNTGLTIDSLKIPNESKIVIGEKREGFLKLKNKLVVDVNNSNPYIVTSNISGYVYEPKKKWYEKMWVNFAIGLGAGYIGSQVINKK